MTDGKPFNIVQQDFSHLSIYLSVIFLYIYLWLPSISFSCLYIFLKFTHKLTLSESLCLSLSAYLSHDECLLLLSQFSFIFISLSRWLSGKESTCWCRIHGFDPWVGKIPQRRKWQHTPVFLPGKSHGQRSLEGYSWWGCKELNDWARVHTHTHTHTHTSIHFRQNQRWGDCKISRKTFSLIE